MKILSAPGPSRSLGRDTFTHSWQLEGCKRMRQDIARKVIYPTYHNNVLPLPDVPQISIIAPPSLNSKNFPLSTSSSKNVLM